MIKKIADNWTLWLVASLSLGLAPFVPEPHIWGKLKWLSGGAIGMQFQDYFDLFFHGIPWLLLCIALLYKAVK